MEKNSVKGQININATPEKIWNVLTNPEKIIQYTGSKVNTDWQEGSSITWSGEMHGMSYSNKGEILKIEPNAQLKHTFWTGIGGDKDMPEHYSEVSLTLNEKDDRTVELTYLRTGIATETEGQMFQMHSGNPLTRSIPEKAMVKKARVLHRFSKEFLHLFRSVRGNPAKSAARYPRQVQSEFKTHKRRHVKRIHERAYFNPAYNDSYQLLRAGGDHGIPC